MSLQAYGVLKGKIKGFRPDRNTLSPHYQIHVIAGKDHYRISVNIKSTLAPSELLYFINESYRNPIIHKLDALPYGFFFAHELGIDYVRGENGFTRKDMKEMPSSKVGPNNDLNELISQYLKYGQNGYADIYVFGTKWAPYDINYHDRTFGFCPAFGMHNVHMNQGNTKKWQDDDGVWQDGCILLHLKKQEQWLGIFLAFQSQSWHTDSGTGRKNN